MTERSCPKCGSSALLRLCYTHPGKTLCCVCGDCFPSEVKPEVYRISFENELIDPNRYSGENFNSEEWVMRALHNCLEFLNAEERVSWKIHVTGPTTAASCRKVLDGK